MFYAQAARLNNVVKCCVGLYVRNNWHIVCLRLRLFNGATQDDGGRYEKDDIDSSVIGPSRHRTLTSELSGRLWFVAVYTFTIKNSEDT